MLFQFYHKIFDARQQVLSTSFTASLKDEQKYKSICSPKIFEDLSLLFNIIVPENSIYIIIIGNKTIRVNKLLCDQMRFQLKI